MPKTTAAALLLLLFAARAARSQSGGNGSPGQATVELTWYGQSCFLLQSPGHTHILIDPLSAASGYPLPQPLQAELITLSDLDEDASNEALASGRPPVFRGVSEDGKRWVAFNKRIGDVQVSNVGAYHDATQGADRGLESLFIFETGGLRIVHLGNLGHLLTKEQIKKIGRVDVLLVPSGGLTTIDPKRAHQVIGQLKPRYYIIAMHYGTDVAATHELKNFEEFRGLEDPVTKNVEATHKHTFQIALDNLPQEPKILELDYQ